MATITSRCRIFSVMALWGHCSRHLVWAQKSRRHRVAPVRAERGFRGSIFGGNRGYGRCHDPICGRARPDRDRLPNSRQSTAVRHGGVAPNGHPRMRGGSNNRHAICNGCRPDTNSRQSTHSPRPDFSAEPGRRAQAAAPRFLVRWRTGREGSPPLTTLLRSTLFS